MPRNSRAPAPTPETEESLLGNIFEGVFTYGILFVYTIVMLVFIMAFPDAQTPEEQVFAMRFWVVSTVVSITLYAIGCAVSTQARHAIGPLRIGVALIGAISPLAVPFLMGADAFGYVNGGIDNELALYTGCMPFAFVAIFTVLWAASRRVEEYAKDR